MGVSTNGILVFGFQIGDDGDEPEFLGAAHEDFEDFALKLAGHKDDEATDFGARYKAEKAALEECPADLTVHCSGEYPMYILAVRGTKKSAKRGYPEEITPDILAVAPERIAAFKAWCKKAVIEYQEPKWWLCSMWD